MSTATLDPLPGIDVEHRRLAAACNFTGGALDDVAAGEELLDQQTDGAAAHVHAAGEVGAGDRLVAADEGERDLTVDVPRGAPGGDVEACWGRCGAFAST